MSHLVKSINDLKLIELVLKIVSLAGILNSILGMTVTNLFTFLYCLAEIYYLSFECCLLSSFFNNTLKA